MSDEKNKLTEGEREGLIRAVQSVTWNASNYPRGAQPHILGQDVVPLTMEIVESVIAAGFRLEVPQSEPSDAQVEAARLAFREVMHRSGTEKQADGLRAALRAAWRIQ